MTQDEMTNDEALAFAEHELDDHIERLITDHELDGREAKSLRHCLARWKAEVLAKVTAKVEAVMGRGGSTLH